MIYQQPLEAPYTTLSDDELIRRIQRARAMFKEKAVILTHHYQRPEIVALADERGDSLRLAQYVASLGNVEYVFYCGVHFMAESADILKKGDQKIILPDLQAGCDMADMAQYEDILFAWGEVEDALGNNDIMPITYVNSSAAVKAFVGKKDGVVCTSSNAAKIISWAFIQKKRIFFFPDQYLGLNTCKKLGVPMENIVYWNKELPSGGLSPQQIKNAKVILWPGYCPVHKQFTAQQIAAIHAKDPEFKIIVHPECESGVVENADYVGSTELIVDTIAKAPPGSKWAVGTEMNLVTRIIADNPTKTVISLNSTMCLCETMNRIDLPHLAWAMENAVNGTPKNIITVDESIRKYALLSLNRMLDIK